MPELVSAVDGRSDTVLVTVAINGSAKQYDWVAKRKLNGNPVLVDRRMKTANAFGVRAVPTTFFLDRKGVVTKRLIGGYHKKDFMAALDKLE